MKTATEHTRGIGRLMAGDLPNVVANAFGIHPSTICHLWHWLQTTGTIQDALKGHTRF